MWGEVAQELNTTPYAIRAKWKALRYGFRTRLRKVRARPSGDAGLEFSDCATWPHFKSLYFLKDQYRSYARRRGIRPGEKKILKYKLTNTGDGGLEISQYSGSGKELKPSADITKKRSRDVDMEFLMSSNVPFLQALGAEMMYYTLHASSGGIPPEEKKTLTDEQTDTRNGEIECSEYSWSEKELKPCVKVLKRRSGDGALEFLKYSKAPFLVTLGLQVIYDTLQASSGDIPPEERNILRDEQTDIRDGVLESPEYSGSEKELKSCGKVLKRRSFDDALEFSGHSSLPTLQHLCFQKDKFTP
jgi:hypothetical protein